MKLATRFVRVLLLLMTWSQCDGQPSRGLDGGERGSTALLLGSRLSWLPIKSRDVYRTRPVAFFLFFYRLPRGKLRNVKKTSPAEPRNQNGDGLGVLGARIIERDVVSLELGKEEKKMENAERIVYGSLTSL